MLMRLLQLPVTALEQAIKDEVEKNPLLEVENCQSEATKSLDKISADISNDEIDDDDYRYREQQEFDKNQKKQEHIFTATLSFSEYLLQQLNMLNLSERSFAIAKELIGCVDDAGYLRRDLALIANDLAFRQGIDASIAELEEVLSVVQSLEPVGVGARSVQECLSLQLHHIENQDESVLTAIDIIDRHFELFSNHLYAQLCDKLKITTEQFESAVAVIRSLNPKPGEDDDVEQQKLLYMIPDWTVSQQGGELFFSVNDRHSLDLHLNDYYQELHKTLASQSSLNAEQKATLDFLSSKTDDANILIDTLQQRHATMSRIFVEILKIQKKFFLTGDINDMKPLKQKDIAEATGFDVSTISRVVNSKYVQTDFGTFPLKDCFSTAFANEEGEMMATESVKQELLKIVEGEDKSNPLTDEELCALMKEKGIPLARRTVAKYREALGIPVRRLRKGLKVIILILLSVCAVGLSLPVCAQAPMSYYDSIIYKQQHSSKSVKQKAPNAEHKKTDVVDSSLLKGDDMIDQRYIEGTAMPSHMWYGNYFPERRVRPFSVSFDSLPDDINIRLVKNDNDFCFPVKNIITSPYGWRWNRPHRGVDIRLNTGDPVHCVFSGVVRIACPMGAYGNLVVVRHFNGLETVYGHLSKIKVRPHQPVKAGDVLGLGGSTGHSTGPHLHFEVRFQYECFDPEWILDFQTYKLRTHRLHLDKTYFGITKPRHGQSLSYKADKSFIKEEPEKAQRPQVAHYTIKKGDKLSDIAEKYHTTVDKIKELNPEVTKFKKGVRIRVK